MNLLLDLEEFVDAAFDEFCAQVDSQIDASADGKATIDLGILLQFLAMDVVGELAFGQSFGASTYLCHTRSQRLQAFAETGLCKAGYDTAAYLPMLDAYTASACLSGTK